MTGYDDNPYLFKGGIQDRASGFVKFGLRWYNPTTGTWTQQDTLDAPLDPKNANRYQFAGGDPINGSDPAGRALGGDAVGAVVSSGLGLAIGGVACALSGLVVCAVASIVGGALAGALGGIAGSAVDGNTITSDYQDAALSGAVTGAIGGAIGGIGGRALGYAVRARAGQ